MTDATGGGRGPSARGRSSRADGGVHFEERIALSDSRYSGLSTVASAMALVGIVAMPLFVLLALVLFFGFVAVMSGTSIVDLVTTVASGVSPFVLLFVAVFALVLVGGLALVVLQVVRRGGLAHTNEIHTRVSDDGVAIDREGGYLGQSSGVTIPFETITAVEYNDPEGDLKMNLEDVRAKKFIGGRGGDWVRIERRDRPAVYVGSDRPRALAEVVGDLAPDVDGAEPFS